MSIVKKLLLNLGWRAILVLGPTTYLRYLLAFFWNLRQIRRDGDFKSLDKVMGSRRITVHMNGEKFIIDCPYIDEHIKDGTFTFGILREMFIRNCYLRHGVSRVAKRPNIVVLDLGANRGTFSTMMARHARLVVAVDCSPVYKEVIAHNMAVNGFANCITETLFLAQAGSMKTVSSPE